jgi:hypothetical protein
MPEARRSRNRISGPGACAIAIVCLLGQVLTAAHEATERHVRCAEHGELSHLGVLAPAADASPSTRTDAGFDGKSARELGGHAHCAVLAARRREVTRPILLVALAPEAGPHPVPHPAPLLAPLAKRILLSAPKIAPPSARS